MFNELALVIADDFLTIFLTFLAEKPLFYLVGVKVRSGREILLTMFTFYLCGFELIFFLVDSQHVSFQTFLAEKIELTLGAFDQGIGIQLCHLLSDSDTVMQ